MTHYKVPKEIVPLAFYQTIEKGGFKTVREFLERHNFASIGDLKLQGFQPSNIEDAVNSEDVRVVYWPEENPMIHLYFGKNRKSQERLEELAKIAKKICVDNTKDERGPIGLDFLSVGSLMGDHLQALVGLVYAREQEEVSEMPLSFMQQIPQLSHLRTPLYIVNGGYLDTIVRNLISRHSFN